jgi:hypothetical protein
LSRARILFAFAALIALASVLAACGSSSSDDPQSVVEEATLKGVESGKLDLSLQLGIAGEKSGNVDVKLSGPFQSEEEAELPEVDLAFAVKSTVGGKKLDREGAFTLLGSKAYVGYEGTEYEVDSTTFDFVKSLLKKQGKGQGQGSEIAACQEAASDFELDDFVENLKGEGSADVGGTTTTKISGDLNTEAAAEVSGELLEDPACSEQLKAASGQLPSAAELDQAKSTLKDSIKSTHVELYVGDDHIVRRVVAEATIEPPKGSQGGAKKVDLHLDMTLTGVNEEQTITAPSGSRPLSDLFLKLGINPIELLGAFQNSGGEGLGSLLEGLSKSGGGSSGGGNSGGGSSGGGQESYYECLGKAQTPVDIQNCTGLLQ